jgi:tRNA(fMet)-specific endonuclease VapC
MDVLDTDLLSLLRRGNADSLPLQMRLDRTSPHDIVTTIVTYEEQMRGWLAFAAQATTTERMLVAYARLEQHIEAFQGVRILAFDAKAAAEFDRLREARVRIGTMDLKIAAIVLANNGTLLTRNVEHFSKVPGLRVEDWSA